MTLLASSQDLTPHPPMASVEVRYDSRAAISGKLMQIDASLHEFVSDPREQDPADSTAISVAYCQESEASAWDGFVSAQPRGSFSLRWACRTAIERSLGCKCFYLAAYRNRRITGVLPLVLVSSKLFGRILCSMPFVNYGGPIASDQDSREKLVAAAIKLTRELDCDYLELRSTVALGAELPGTTHKVSLALTLNPDPQAIWNSFTGKHRKNIRRAQKRGLSVTSGGAELLTPFYSVMEHSWRQLGTPLYSRAFFESFASAVGKDARLFVCTQDGKVIAAAFNGEFGSTLEGIWSATLPECRELEPNYVLYWEMIRFACESGLTTYNLGRSTAGSGTDLFKRRWSTEATALHWHYYLHRATRMPALNVDNPKLRIAIAAWRHMPLWATRAIGTRIAPLIP